MTWHVFLAGITFSLYTRGCLMQSPLVHSATTFLPPVILCVLPVPATPLSSIPRLPSPPLPSLPSLPPSCSQALTSW